MPALPGRFAASARPSFRRRFAPGLGGDLAVASRPLADYFQVVKSGLIATLLKVSVLAGFWLGLANFTVAADTNQFATRRMRIVQEQLSGPGCAITNARVRSALGRVPRHEFVPERYRDQASDDRPLPIGYGQTISQPYIVAFMTERLEPRPTDRVLEIGTGSGYQAAVLAELVAKVHTIEIIEPLARRAQADMQRLGYTNVLVRAGDGYQGWPEASPFDAIIVTCAPDKVPQPLIEQLKDGGRLIIPLGEIGDQKLVLLRKRAQCLEKTMILPVRFVPMTGEAQH